MKLVFLLCTLIFFSLFSFDASSIEIVRLRGTVTQSSAQDPVARRLRESDKVREFSTIETGANGVVTLKLPDQTQVTLGRDTRLVLNQARAGAPTVLVLNYGRMRVQAESPEDGELFVGTPEGVMATGGAEFHVFRYEENQVVSLLVYSGSVNFNRNHEGAKLRQALREYFVSETAGPMFERGRDGEIEFNRDTTTSQRRRYRIQALLAQPEARVVPAGHFSSLLPSLEMALVPQRISPAQLNALFANRELNRPDQEDLRPLSEEALRVAPTIPWGGAQARPEGELHFSRGHVTPKAGGFIHFMSGLYIEPEDDAPYFEAQRVYIPRRLGTIDRDSGYYLPPEGVVLSHQGFSGTAPLAQQLNERLSLRLQEPSRQKKSSLSVRELMTMNYLSFTLSPFSQSLEQGGLVKEKYSSRLGMSYDFAFSHGSGRWWQFEHRLSLRSLEFKAPSTMDVDRSSLFGFSLGARAFLTNRLSVVTHLGVEQDHYVEPDDESAQFSSKFTPVNSTKWRLILEWQAIRSSNFSLATNIGLINHFSKGVRRLRTKNGMAYYFDLQGTYWIDSRWSVFGGPWLQSLSQDLTVAGEAQTVDRQTTGGSIGLSYRY